MKYYCTAEYCVWRLKEGERFVCMFPGNICPKGKCISREKETEEQEEDKP